MGMMSERFHLIDVKTLYGCSVRGPNHAQNAVDDFGLFERQSMPEFIYFTFIYLLLLLVFCFLFVYLFVFCIVFVLDAD